MRASSLGDLHSIALEPGRPKQPWPSLSRNSHEDDHGGVRDTTTIWRMPLMRDIAAGIAAAAAGLALTACATAAAPHDATLTASNSAASKSAKTARAKPRPTATHATQAAAPRTLPAAGNPRATRSCPARPGGEHKSPEPRHR